MKMTKQMQALAEQAFMAAAADAAAPYRALANEIATLAGARGKVTEKASELGSGIWGAFRSALDIGLAANHDADTIAIGLTVACEEAGVPGGTQRSYIGTVRNMYAAVQAGSVIGPSGEPVPFTREQALTMKIADARVLFMDAAKKALKAARERLAEATRKWTPAQLDDLTAYVNAENAAREAEKQAEKDAANG